MLCLLFKKKKLHSPPPFIHPIRLQGVKPLSTIPLTGCSVEDSPQDGHPCFCLGQSKTTHMFSCDSLDLKERWLAVLKVTVTGTMPADTPTGSDIATNGTACGINDNGSDGSVSSGEDSNINGNKENSSWMLRHCWLTAGTNLKWQVEQVHWRYRQFLWSTYF